MHRILLRCIVLTFILNMNISVHAGIGDYINNIGKYFGFKKDADENYNQIEYYTPKVPYEVSTSDEKFLAEAAKLTGVVLSDLDLCQQKVVLKLQTDCDKMNDEQLAKMAVHLLNCQSHVEGRPIYPCTDEMSIKDCTTSMDSDTWTSYHLMSNRARAVCYSIRQSQFRGLAEITINRLMDTTKDQLLTLGKLARGQENLRHIASDTFVTLTKGHENLNRQQQDIQKAQLHGQLTIEDNIRRLVDEKRIIRETHNQLVQMTNEVQKKLENSAKVLEGQMGETKANHKELLNDLTMIQETAKEIFDKIDQSANMLIQQNEEFNNHYRETLKNLNEVNKTVHNLVSLVGGTRQALEERLAWITTALGGTDLAIERLYLVLWHAGFMMVTMLGSAFLSARSSTRLVVAALPSLNLIVGLYGDRRHFDPVVLSCVLGSFVVGQTLLFWALSLRPVVRQALQWKKDKPTTTKESQQPHQVTSTNSILSAEIRESLRYRPAAVKLRPDDRGSADEEEDAFDSLTPPLSRNGHYPSLAPRSRSRSGTPAGLFGGGSCGAKTRAGTPCRLRPLPGRDFCHRHQAGDSVMG